MSLNELYISHPSRFYLCDSLSIFTYSLNHILGTLSLPPIPLLLALSLVQMDFRHFIIIFALFLSLLGQIEKSELGKWNPLKGSWKGSKNHWF